MRQKIYFISAVALLVGLSAAVGKARSNREDVISSRQTVEKRAGADGRAKFIFNPGEMRSGLTNPEDVAVKYAASPGLTFAGALHYSSAWEGNPVYGLYRFSSNPEDRGVSTLISDYYFFERGNGVVYDGMLHAVSFNDYNGELYVNYNKIDLGSGDYVDWKSYPDLSMLPYDADYDPLTGGVVGCFSASDNVGTELAVVEYNTGYRKVLKELPSILYAVAVSSKGDIYGIDGEGVLRLYPRDGGAEESIMSTGLKPLYMQSATVDYQNDHLYWAFTDGTRSALYEIDPAKKEISKLFDFANCEEYTCLYIERENSSEVPASPYGLDINLDGEGFGTIGFAMPSATKSGTPLTGEMAYELRADGKLVLSGKAQAGSSVSERVSLPIGETLIMLMCSNTEGNSIPLRHHVWIGAGCPENPSDLQYHLEGNTVRLEWTAPAGGVLGAYVDPADITYNVVRYPEGITVATGLSATSYVDEIPMQQPTVCWYAVSALSNGFESEETVTEKFAVGDCFTVPWSEDFENPDNFSLFSVIDANADGREWMVGLKQGFNPTGFAFCNTNKYGLTDIEFSDDWLLSPRVSLSAEGIYELKFKYWSGWGTLELLETSIGQGDDPTDESSYTVVMPVSEVTNQYDNAHEFSYRWIPSSDGKYRVAFHGLTGYQGFNFSIDDISIEQIGCSAAPGAPEQFNVVAGERGALEAEVSFTVPERNARGDAEMVRVTSAELYRDGTLVKSWRNPDIGERLTYSDKNVAEGKVKYEAVCYSDEGRGMIADKEVYIGKDVPGLPLDLKARDCGQSVELSWKSPGSVGANGGYVDAGMLSYDIYGIDNGVATLLKGDIQSTSCVLDFPVVAGQSRVYYGVSAKCGDDMGDILVANPVIAGAAHELPFTETFKLAKYDNAGWIQKGDIEHIFYTDAEVSADDESASLKWMPEIGYRETWLETGKINPGKNSGNLQLLFDYCAADGCDVILDVYAVVDGWDEQLVNTLDFSAVENKGQWHKAMMDLSAFAGSASLVLKFHAYGEALGQPLWLDRIQVRNLLECDLIAGLETKKRYTAGRQGEVVIKVDNNSLQPETDYTLNLYCDGENVASFKGDPVEGLGSLNYTVSIVPSALKSGIMEIIAEVELEGDKDKSNNTSASHTVDVISSSLAAPESLTLTENDGKVQLSWMAPKAVKEEVVEDFESYDNGDLVFGDWKTYDMDKGLACGINGIDMPHVQEPFAFMVFNPVESGIDIDLRPEFAPVVDSQYLMCMTGYYSSLGHNDDWLISPELSGEAQSVYMFLRKNSDQYNETFEIYYSLTDDELESFILLESGSVEDVYWYDYGFDLPEGAKYFAFRYTAPDQFLICIDDITYRPAMPQLKGYRVYRNGVIAGECSVDETECEVPESDKESAEYCVTAVYDKGESGASNKIATSSVTMLKSSGREVWSGNGEIVITAPEGSMITVYGMDGVEITGYVADGSNRRIKVSPGIYLVDFGCISVKAVVK